MRLSRFSHEKKRLPRGANVILYLQRWHAEPWSNLPKTTIPLRVHAHNLSSGNGKTLHHRLPPRSRALAFSTAWATSQGLWPAGMNLEQSKTVSKSSTCRGVTCTNNSLNISPNSSWISQFDSDQVKYKNRVTMLHKSYIKPVSAMLYHPIHRVAKCSAARIISESKLNYKNNWKSTFLLPQCGFCSHRFTFYFSAPTLIRISMSAAPLLIKHRKMKQRERIWGWIKNFNVVTDQKNKGEMKSCRFLGWVPFL